MATSQRAFCLINLQLHTQGAAALPVRPAVVSKGDVSSAGRPQQAAPGTALPAALPPGPFTAPAGAPAARRAAVWEPLLHGPR